LQVTISYQNDFRGTQSPEFSDKASKNKMMKRVEMGKVPAPSYSQKNDLTQESVLWDQEAI
jgi:hypothetical protein